MPAFLRNMKGSLASALAAAFGLAVAASGVLAAVASAGRWFPPCPLHSFLGLYCPACGGVRATSHLLHGDVLAAFSMNPLFVLLLFAAPFLLLLPQRAKRAAFPWAFLGVVAAFGVARNIPLWPLSLLAPP